LSNEMSIILNNIQVLQQNNSIAGRAKITENLNALGYNITQSQIRTRLNSLEKMGYIYKKMGKHGTVLTEKGIKYLQNNIVN